MLESHAFRLQGHDSTDPWPEMVALGCRVCEGPLEDHQWYVYDEDHPTNDGLCTLVPATVIGRMLV